MRKDAPAWALALAAILALATLDLFGGSPDLADQDLLLLAIGALPVVGLGIAAMRVSA